MSARQRTTGPFSAAKQRILQKGEEVQASDGTRYRQMQVGKRTATLADGKPLTYLTYQLVREPVAA